MTVSMTFNVTSSFILLALFNFFSSVSFNPQFHYLSTSVEIKHFDLIYYYVCFHIVRNVYNLYFVKIFRSCLFKMIMKFIRDLNIYTYNQYSLENITTTNLNYMRQTKVFLDCRNCTHYTLHKNCCSLRC